jgi:hypothetical protein
MSNVIDLRMTTGKIQQTAFTALCEVSARISTKHHMHIQRTNRVHMIALLLAFAATGYSQTASPKAPPPKVFGGARIQEIYRVSLDRDALLLESIQDIVKQKDIREGHVFITAGAIQECTYHYNANTDAVPVNVFKTVGDPQRRRNHRGRRPPHPCHARTWRSGHSRWAPRKGLPNSLPRGVDHREIRGASFDEAKEC